MNAKGRSESWRGWAVIGAVFGAAVGAGAAVWWMGSNTVVALAGVMALGLYFAPAVLARRLGHPSASAIGALNLLLGWTFVGWVAALVWALSAPRPGR